MYVVRNVAGDGNCFYRALHAALQANAVARARYDVPPDFVSLRKVVADLARCSAVARTAMAELLVSGLVERNTCMVHVLQELLDADLSTCPDQDGALSIPSDVHAVVIDMLRTSRERTIDIAIGEFARRIETSNDWASAIESIVVKEWLDKLDVVMLTVSREDHILGAYTDCCAQTRRWMQTSVQPIVLMTDNAHYKWVEFVA